MRERLSSGLRVKLVQLLASFQFGFVESHRYLTTAQLGILGGWLRNTSYAAGDAVRTDYERRFARLVGDGHATSFAAARMAFYAYMEVLDIGPGDEVILTGFTCAVMPNAVLKRGATPVFTDVDPVTFGSSTAAITGAITSKTRLIVAQHSFGIPCDIPGITRVAQARGIPVLEDCALTLGSAIDGTPVGNWGDAAIFSTDHSKPLNTITGGILYTRSPEIHQKVVRIAGAAAELSVEHQAGLYRQMLFERRFYGPDRYPRARLLGSLIRLWQRMTARQPLAFLVDNDVPPRGSRERYPYPARMPVFLAQLGLYELERWPEQQARRVALLQSFIALSNEYTVAPIPSVYRDLRRNIVPLRYVFTTRAAEVVIHTLSRFFDTNWIWFRQPLVCATEGPASLGYKPGACPVSEAICAQVVNVPCNIMPGWAAAACRSLEIALSEAAGAYSSTKE